MRYFLIALAVCFCPGCLMDAGKLAGFYQPKASVRAGHVKVDIGTDFTGSLKGKYNPETKLIDVDLQVTSNASNPLGAQGERADHLIELRKLETTYLLEAQKQVGENFKAFGTMLAIAATAGGDAVAKLIDAAAPILKGSSVSGPLGIGATLGGPGPPETPAGVPP